MADAVFFVRPQFGCGLAQALYDEQRVVAKTVRSPRCAPDFAVPAAFGHQRLVVLRTLDECHDANVISETIMLEVFEEFLVVAGIAFFAGALTAGVVGGM